MLVPALLSAVALGGAGLVSYASNRIQARITRAYPPRADMIDVGGMYLHVRITGPAHKSPILILHGAASNLEEPYLALADTLTDEHVIWIDRPGLGWSERPDGPWSPQREADVLVQLLDHLGHDVVRLVGHSWGGAIAMRTALDHGKRVSGLVLIAPALSAWIGEAAWFNKATFWPIFGLALSHWIVPLIGEDQLASGAKHAFHPEPVPAGYLDKSNLSLLLRPEVWRANAEDMARVNTHLEDQENRYADLDHPVIMLAGKADTVLWTKRHAVAVSQRVPNAELRMIEGAGHNLHHHHPQQVLHALSDIQARTAG